MAAPESPRSLPPGLLGGLLFFSVVIFGCGYIVFSKLQKFEAITVTLVPVSIMVGYALLLALGRLFRLRDDQSGDNLYYMGFLFTLTSLGVSLYQYSSEGSAEQIVQNFGIAIASTIAGIALRIFFNQMRRDPAEVEHFARLELADASRKVKRELESTVLEFGYFRRATQQSIEDSLSEVKELLKDAKNNFVGQLGQFAVDSSKPLEEASRKSSTAIDEINAHITESLKGISVKLSAGSERLSDSSAAAVKSLGTVVAKLEAMQAPDQIIEIKLNPAVQTLTRAVNNFSKNVETQAQTVDANLKQTQLLVANAETQAQTVDANLKQTQLLAGALTALITEIRAANAAHSAAPSASAPRPHGTSVFSDIRQQFFGGGTSTGSKS